MPEHICLFCGCTYPLLQSTFFSATFPAFDQRLYPEQLADGYFEITLYTCPRCKHTEIIADRPYGKQRFSTRVFPRSSSKALPEYIPEAIRNDYLESCAIAEVSPKAAAMLCRRCLQGMIHDFWNIHEKNLNAEISALKNRIPASQWLAIDAVRRIGNIGAHMEHDVNQIIDIEPIAAQKLIQLIERLIQHWYIDRHNEEELISEILNVDSATQSQRNQ